MRILITGNMGYVGPVVVKHLRATMPDVFLGGYDTGYFGNCLTTTEVFPESYLDVQHFGDVRRVDDRVFDGVDAVVHLAGISNDPIGNQFEADTLDINHRATVALAKQARDNGVGCFIFASSCSMYGAAEDTPRTETSALNPLTAYAKSKVFAERDLEPLATDSFSITCLRFSTACGMSDRLRLDLVLNDFVACAVSTGEIKILSDGTPWRPLINVKDMARAIEWALSRNRDAGDYLAVNVGSTQWNYQVKELAETVAEVIPGVEISVNPDAPPDKRSYRVSFDLFEKLAPNHQPKVDLRSAIAELKAGLERIGFKDADFHNSRFMRLKVLEALRASNDLDEHLRWRRSVPVR